MKGSRQQPTRCIKHPSRASPEPWGSPNDAPTWSPPNNAPRRQAWLHPTRRLYADATLAPQRPAPKTKTRLEQKGTGDPGFDRPSIQITERIPHHPDPMAPSTSRFSSTRQTSAPQPFLPVCKVRHFRCCFGQSLAGGVRRRAAFAASPPVWSHLYHAGCATRCFQPSRGASCLPDNNQPRLTHGERYRISSCLSAPPTACRVEWHHSLRKIQHPGR